MISEILTGEINIKKVVFLIFGSLLLFVSIFLISITLFEKSNKLDEFNNGMEDHIFAEKHMVLDASMDEFNNLREL